MKTFNLTSYENGKIIKTVTAKTIQETKNNLESKGYDCHDDYFLESVADATANFLKSPRYAEIENIMQNAEQNDNEYLFTNYKN